MRWGIFAGLAALVCSLAPGAGAIDVTFECAADYYASGDSVFFTWTNNTDSTIVAGNHPPFDIYHADTNELVCVISLPMEFHLGPHETAYLDWDQLDCEWNLVPPGRYIARIGFVIGMPPPYFIVEDDFVIVAPASVPEDGPTVQGATWGRVRSEYR